MGIDLGRAAALAMAIRDVMRLRPLLNFRTGRLVKNHILTELLPPREETAAFTCARRTCRESNLPPRVNRRQIRCGRCGTYLGRNQPELVSL
jgi:uncharacterized paraquat-inducible protein A